MLYGEVVSVPMVVPLARKVTEVTPTLSDADAETASLPEMVAPSAGALRETVGAVVSEEPEENTTSTQ